MSGEHLPVLIVVAPLVMSFVTHAAGWFARGLCYPLVVFTLGSCLVFAFSIMEKILRSGQAIHYRLGGWEPPWGIEYVIDHLNGLVLVCASAVAFLVAVYSRRILEDELPDRKLPQFYTLFLLQTVGLFGITVTGDAFNLYVLLEIASFSAYAIIAMGGKGSEFASFRYMIFGTIGACAYLIGVGYLYILTGSLNMADLRGLLEPFYGSRVLVTGFAFLLVGIAIKMGLFPVHTWLPDSYTAAPSAVSALLAPLFTKVGAYVLIRVLFTVFDPVFAIKMYPVMTVLGWVAAAGVGFGTIMAIAQTDLKRMLCYLIIIEMGYIVIGVSSANQFGLIGAVFHLVNDMFMMACLFMVAGTIYVQTGTRDIRQFGGLVKQMPLTVIVFVMVALSVVGVPPMSGFFSKWYLILGTVQAGQWVFLAVILLSSLGNAVLFFRVIENAFFEPGENKHLEAESPGFTLRWERVPVSVALPMICLAGVLLLMGLYSRSIIQHVIEGAVPRIL